MSKMMLRPNNDVLDIEGNVIYSTNWGAWNTIRLRKDILDQFPQLKDRKLKIGYRLLFYKTYDELLSAVNRIKEKKEAIPILLYLYQQ